MGEPRAKPVSVHELPPYLQKVAAEAEALNAARVKSWLVRKRWNRITGIGLGAFAIGVYVYTITAVKQETFLDDLDEPAKAKS